MFTTLLSVSLRMLLVLPRLAHRRGGGGGGSGGSGGGECSRAFLLADFGSLLASDSRFFFSQWGCIPSAQGW